MTNEEAIRAMLFAKRDVLADSHIDKAFDKAIEALKADSTQDSISRQDAIDAVNAYLGLSAVSRTIQNMTSIQDILERLPSAEPEPEPVGCSGCRYERFGNRACDVCSRFYADRYEAERRTDEE